MRTLVAFAFVLATGAATTTSSPAASSAGVSVSLSVLSATEVDVTGCTPGTAGSTLLGVTLPGGSSRP